MTAGNFMVRLGPSLHASLKRTAEAEAVSLNELCIKRLQLPGVLEFVDKDLGDALTCLTAMTGEALVGIAIFGSWARGEANDLSDVDVLVVLNDATKITRHLYRLWEASDASKDRKVEPHFVALPRREDRVSGLWAEVSLDGVMVCDRGFRLQRHLRHVRSLIASGKLVSRRVHGQNYWIHTEVA